MVMIGKVHIGGVLSSLTNSSSLGGSSFGQSSFPRRSSLLPSVSTTNDLHFDDELHSLSPVPHLQSYFSNSGLKNNCKNIRDAADNRITLIYQDGRMFRIALPLLSETTVVSKCLLTLRQVLPKDVSMKVRANTFNSFFRFFLSLFHIFSCSSNGTELATRRARKI
jgi:anaphase-promoting complex subunit 1